MKYLWDNQYFSVKNTFDMRLNCDVTCQNQAFDIIKKECDLTFHML